MAGVGAPSVSTDIAGGGVNFYPHTRSASEAPVSGNTVSEPPLPLEGDAWVGIHDSRDEDNFSQAGQLYRLMSDDQKSQLAGNIAGGLSQASEEVQQIMLGYFTQADSEYGEKVRQALNAV